MNKKTRRKYTPEEKRKAVADFISGTKTAQQVVQDLDTDPNAVYRWKAIQEEEAKGVSADEIIFKHSSQELSDYIKRQQDEIEAYQKKVAEQALIIDLLKKLRQQGSLPPESELSGLIATMFKSVRNKRPAK